MKKKVSSLCYLLLLLTGLSLHGQATSEYKLENKFKMPATGSWDYLTVDESSDRVFVSHATMVVVLDLKTGNVVGTINDTPGVHGIAIAADLNKAFISNGRDSSVTVIDLKTLAFITKITGTGQNPDAIIYDQFSSRIFTFNGGSSNSTVIDAKTNQKVGTIPLAGKPEFPAPDGKGKMYVNIEDKSLISVINTKTMNVEASWSIAPGEEPSGLALDNETHRLFSVCSNKLMVIVDAANGKVVTTLPIGGGCDGVKFDPGLKRAYSSNGEGTMTVVQEINKDSFKVLETVPTMPGARTLAVDTRTHHIYLPSAEYETAPAATAPNNRQRRTMKPDSFTLLDFAYLK
jgi:YVTN family beta-propeller protein